MPNPDSLPPGWDMTEPAAALAAFLGTLPATPRLLALGEPTHGIEAFPAWRNRLFRTLVQEHGFRSIALESDVIAGLRVNAHVTEGHGTLDEALQTGFSHGFGALEANRALVRWIRDFNPGRAPEDQLRFYGFDPPLEWWAPSPRASLLALHAFLSAHLGSLPVDAATLERLCGEEARWTNPAAVMDAAQSIGDSREARQLRRLADDLDTLLQTETPALAAQEGFWEAQLHARTAPGLLRYHALLASHVPGRMERAAALRDLMMADNLMAIAGREQERGPTLVFAHNTHLQRHRAAMKLGDLNVKWWGAGAHVSLRLGHGYAFIASHLRTAPVTGFDEADPDTGEPVPLNGSGPAVLFIPRAQIPQAGSLPSNVDDPPLADGVLADGVLAVENAPDWTDRIRPAAPPDQGAP
ncbi:erythromycin esterase family protein [Deinococcus koreensis]|uniref:Erythromycin esterase n=1 Tax=Deinococcus koreensis TaxID=2054903 RepID=A0A2K3UWA2_9DEIO|nr:erythromycin esterase family protein [Deinococcus koreensis]PNY80812.1 erythromycin esterase [Deinococcus koreensis]